MSAIKHSQRPGTPEKLPLNSFTDNHEREYKSPHHRSTMDSWPLKLQFNRDLSYYYLVRKLPEEPWISAGNPCENQGPGYFLPCMQCYFN